ncbi:hypothetical protein [Streptomyces rubellomurinus]|uniref:Uncharacterized protein n=2 Tax=Streptomyces TaxID=1883 RepID=A0A0F2TJX2_STRR3|nr:hypothetical protein [Streptomyces rubellomurinus]KJS62575.1 hypothetical protein VM95_08245 [Streptomyces rubellomurinus]
MTLSRARGLGAVTVVAIAAGLLTAPAASAVPGTAVTDPKALPAPGFAATGLHTDACDDSTAPGWLGVANPVLAVAATSPQVRFKLWDDSTPAHDKIVDSTADVTAGAAKLATSALADGHSYTWQAWPEYSPGSGKPAPACHFKVDLTAPALSVSSTDFPASGSGATPAKYAGENGVFTLTGTDAASGVACYQYTLNGTLGVGWDCGSGHTVKAGADGTAQLTLKPKDWGTNVLTVQAMDNAGNVGQPATYTFYAPWDSRPKPAVAGDVDGDGVPDILVPDAQGNLQVISANASDTTPSSTVPAVLAPLHAGWQDDQVVHRGWAPVHAPGDDLLVHPKGNPRALYAYANGHQGDFGNGYPTLIDKPSQCADAGGTWIDCPQGYAADWSASTQLVALGNDEPHEWPFLVSVENGDLWLYSAALRDYGLAQQLTTGGAWAGYDLIAPGKDASGAFQLWARERATGALHAYRIPKAVGGPFDFSALADPSANVVATGFTTAAYPTLGSSGDGDGDGKPDLWAVTANRHLVTFSGWTAPKDLGALH